MVGHANRKPLIKRGQHVRVFSYPNPVRAEPVEALPSSLTHRSKRKGTLRQAQGERVVGSIWMKQILGLIGLRLTRKKAFEDAPDDQDRKYRNACEQDRNDNSNARIGQHERKQSAGNHILTR